MQKLSAERQIKNLSAGVKVKQAASRQKQAAKHKDGAEISKDIKLCIEKDDDTGNQE